MKDKVEVLSYTDELTGVCNRRFFIHLLTLETERQKRYPYPLSLLMIDIDYFKHYNDSNGHLAGDQVLRVISGLIERACDIRILWPDMEGGICRHLINAGRRALLKLPKGCERISPALISPMNGLNRTAS